MLRVLYSHCKTITRVPTAAIHFNLQNVVVLDDVFKNQKSHFKFISGTSESKIPPSFTVKYLMESCGLPSKTAYSAAEKIRLQSKDNPDSVVSLFKNYGFTKTQMAELISKSPSLLMSDPNNNLKPKLEFFSGVGFSPSELTNLIVSTPEIFNGSLQNRIKPSVNFLKSYIGDNASILTIFKRWPKIFTCDLEKVVEPNIALFREQGGLDANIMKLFVSHPRTLAVKPERFREIIEMSKKYGFDPSKAMFNSAVRIFAGMNKSSFEKKLAVFREVGWSEDEIVIMIKKNPACVAPAEEKIKSALEFFTEKYNWKPADFSFHPWLFSLSLEERVMPRHAVLQILKSKGLVSESLKVTTVLKLPEEKFLEKYVTKFEDEIPELMKAYKGGGLRV